MNKKYLLLTLISILILGCSDNMIIDELISKENYSIELWEKRGLNPSPMQIIESMEKETNNFLVKLKEISGKNYKDKEVLTKEITKTVNEFPWDDFDREEKDFIADVLAPAINSLGVNAWDIY